MGPNSTSCRGEDMLQIKPVNRLALASGLVFVLASCMHAQLSSPVTVTTDRGYEGVYLDVLRNARRCYPATTGSAQREIEGTLDATALVGKITFSFRSSAARETFMTADIRSVGRSQTQVDIHVVRGSEQHAKALQGWVDGTSSNCP
jgi:hypothetical protein